MNPAPAAAPAATAKPDATKPDAASDTKPAEDQNPDGGKSIAEIRKDLAKSCFGGPIIAFGFAVPMIFGEKLHETFAPYVSGILMIVFAIWAYLKVGSALLPFGPKDQAASLFNAIGVRFFVVLGVSVLLLAPKTGYGVYRDYIITPILSAGSTIVDKMYQIGVETNPTLAKFAKEDGQCTPTPIKGLDAKLTALKDDLECKVCMIQRAYSYPWSYGLFQVGNGKIFTGLLLMLVGIAPFLMFLFTVADVFMVRMGYVSCTLSAYVAAGCFPASRKYAITGLKSLSDGAMVLITSMIAAMISISMLTTVIENLDKGGQADFAGTGTATPGSIATGAGSPAGDTGSSSPATPPAAKPPAAPPSSTMVPFASNFQTPTTTYATGPMGANTPNGTYASWYRNTYLRQPPPPQNTGFDTFRETPLAGSTLGDVPVVNPFMDNKTPTSNGGSGQTFGLNTRWYGRHRGQDYDCPLNHPLRTMTNARVIYHKNGDFVYRVMNGSQDTMITVRYLHLVVLKPFPVNTIIGPSQSVGYCFDVGSGNTGANAHLHLEIQICDNLSSSESLARMRTKYPASLTPGTIPWMEGKMPGGDIGRNCYLMHPNIFVKGAMSFTGTEAAGFSAVATNFKNFGILDKGFLLVVVICIVSLQVSKQAQRFTSGQGMGMFMKALGQMISGAFAALGAALGAGAKAAETLAPVTGGIAGAVGNIVGGMLGSAPQATGSDKAVNRDAEGPQSQGAMNNVTQGLSGVIANIGSALSVVINNVVTPVAASVARVIIFPAIGAAAQQAGASIVNILTDDIFKDALGDLQETFINTREAIPQVRVEPPPPPMFTVSMSQTELEEGLTKAPDASNVSPSGTGPSDTERTGNSRDAGERQSSENYYDLLGVGPNASQRDIKDAYRSIAREMHSDVNSDADQERFKEITNAFNTLKNMDLREDYDRKMGITRDGSSVPTPQSPSPEPSPASDGTSVPTSQSSSPQSSPTPDIPPETPQLSGTTVAPMPGSETGGGRAASAQDFTPQPRQSVERGYQGPDSSAFEFEGTESSASEDRSDDIPSARQDTSTNRGAVKDTRAEKERERIQEIRDAEAKKAAEERENALKEKREEEEERRAQKEKQEKELRAKREKEEKEAKAKKEKEQQAELARRIAIQEQKEKEGAPANTINKFDRPRVPTGPKSRK